MAAVRKVARAEVRALGLKGFTITESLGYAALSVGAASCLLGILTLVAGLKTGMGPVWNDTMILVATEFGRTVAVNGTGGTDHGTGSAAMLVGGAVKGGRVVADWPGLGQAALFESRDLKPTLGLDQFVAGAVAGHYQVEPGKVMAALFPDTKGAAPVSGLSRA